ncbi:MAG: hypothetical protein M1549_03550 [Candidatus Dependentiae bacterium]|nr:hypothetical protein [Candidatus Dependentiae bacterium]
MPRSSAQVKKLLTYLLPIASAVLLALLVGLAVYRFKRDAKLIVSQIIADQVEQLRGVFKRIDASCRIIGFDHERNYIDFLNVESFVGSEVGSMNLTYPSNWEGPYLPENPTVGGKYYVVIATPKGWFIAPDNGVRLANGKTIGKEIKLGRDANFDALMRDPNALAFNGRPLAARIR